ncbi:MAG: hypothetical protein ABR999_02370 [Methanoregula sp.]|jgi:hypothetical protein|uniref:hypothetical protein n=1 Tax=Methanoregula sp. TaxID=2052170 RepID=UPI003D10A233
MARNPPWKLFLVILSIELFILISAFGFTTFIKWYSIVLGALVVIGIWIIGYYTSNKPDSSTRRFFRERDVARILLGLIFIIASADLFSFYQIFNLQYADFSLTIYLGLYLTGIPILIDGYWPKK